MENREGDEGVDEDWWKRMMKGGGNKERARIMGRVTERIQREMTRTGEQRRLVNIKKPQRRTFRRREKPGERKEATESPSIKNGLQSTNQVATLREHRP